ncbi:MAG: leucine-rich repeat domain-containing protein [Lachnospiraceae bacterium]|nr:leucine-rich repeat domain-containing protein [Lachnospiraceae bacterium]
MIIRNEDGLRTCDTLLSFRGRQKELSFPKQNGNLSAIRRVGAGAFMNNDTLQKVILNEGVVEIGQEAFAGCRKLKHLELPRSAVHVDDQIFSRVNPVEFLSFYTMIPAGKLAGIMECSIRLAAGGYLLNPEILDRSLRERIYSFMPYAEFDIFPVTEEMGYFFSKGRMYTFWSYRKERAFLGKDIPKNEEEAMCERIRNGEENFLEQREYYSLTGNRHQERSGRQKNREDRKNPKQPSAVTLVFLSEVLKREGDHYPVRLILRTERYYYHKAYRICMDKKDYYVYYRDYFANSQPVHMKQDASQDVYTNRGRLARKDADYEKVLRKYDFVTDYL